MSSNPSKVCYYLAYIAYYGKVKNMRAATADCPWCLKNRGKYPAGVIRGGDVRRAGHLHLLKRLLTIKYSHLLSDSRVVVNVIVMIVMVHSIDNTA